MRSAVPLRKTLALWLPSSCSSGPLLEAALLLNTCSLLQPAQFLLGIVREVGGVGHNERVGGEKLRCGDQARHVAADHAARQHSAARGCEGAVQALAVQAAPVIVSVAPVSASVAAKLAAVAAPKPSNVPVDTSPTVVKFPALPCC